MNVVLTAFAAFLFSLLGTAFISTLDVPLFIIGRFLRIIHSENAGIAFGIRLPERVQEGLILFAVLLMCFAARSAHDRLSRMGFGLILGGAFANLFDRLGDGLVTDYFAVGTFPVFNVADSCITIGVGLLILEEVWRRKEQKS